MIASIRAANFESQTTVNTLIRFWHVDCVVTNQIHYEIKPQGKQKKKLNGVSISHETSLWSLFL